VSDSIGAEEVSRPGLAATAEPATATVVVAAATGVARVLDAMADVDEGDGPRGVALDAASTFLIDAAFLGCLRSISKLAARSRCISAWLSQRSFSSCRILRCWSATILWAAMISASESIAFSLSSGDDAFWVCCGVDVSNGFVDDDEGAIFFVLGRCIIAAAAAAAADCCPVTGCCLAPG